MSGAEVRLKGINFLGTLDALGRKQGSAVRREVEQRLGGDVGEALRTGTLLAGGWYPASWYAALLASIVEVTRGTDQLVSDLSRDAVRADFKTLFKIVRLFLSPQYALQQAVRVSRRYVDGGDIELVHAGEGMVHYRLRAYHGYTRLMWRDFMGGMQGVLENIGCRDLTCHILDGGRDGDDHLDVQLRWIP